MKNKQKLASNNNLALYQAVFASHNKTLEHNENIYFLPVKTPPLYSNLATRSEDWQPDEIFQQIDELAKEENWDDWSIKDSFQCLDLVKFGFEKLFDAQWIYLGSDDFYNANTSDHIDFKIVESEADLQLWIEVWGEGVELGNQIYNKALVENPDVVFVVGYVDEEPQHVALLNKSEDVIGVSNFFVPEKTEAAWSSLVGFIQTKFGSIDIVGYEDAETVSKIKSIGFETVGDLTVWLKKL